MAVSDMRCPNCGASMATATFHAGIMRCAYCGSHVHLTGEAGATLANRVNASIQDMQAALAALESQVVSLGDKRTATGDAWKAQHKMKGGFGGCLTLLAIGLFFLSLIFIAAAIGQPSTQKSEVVATMVIMGIFLGVCGGVLLFFGIRETRRRAKAYRQAEQAYLATVNDLDAQIAATKQEAAKIRDKINATLSQI